VGNRLGRFLLGTHSVAFSPDGTRLAASSTGTETIKLWDVESHQEVLTLESQESLFMFSEFSPDGNILGSLSMEGFLHLWRAPSWAKIEAQEKKLESGQSP
jgi:WD40 repeat protein